MTSIFLKVYFWPKPCGSERVKDWFLLEKFRKCIILLKMGELKN
jgi:hypothetical protein